MALELQFRNSPAAIGSLPIYATKNEAFNQSGKEIGALYYRESCVLVSIEETGWGTRAAQIEFLNSSGSWKNGWITFNGSYLVPWDNHPNAFVNDNPRYIIKKTTNIYNGSKVLIDVLYPGDYVYTRPGISYVGSTEHDWLQCFAYKKNGVYKEPGYNLFVDTQVKHSSTNPSVRGSW